MAPVVHQGSFCWRCSIPSRSRRIRVTLEEQRDLTRVLLKAVFVDVPNGRIVAIEPLPIFRQLFTEFCLPEKRHSLSECLDRLPGFHQLRNESRIAVCDQDSPSFVGVTRTDTFHNMGNRIELLRGCRRETDLSQLSLSVF